MNKKEMICYNVDASRIVGSVSKVICPSSIEEVKQAVKNCETDIVPRGGGSSLVGGCVPKNSVVLDLRKMNKVTDFNPLKKTVHVEPGVTVKELNEKLASVKYEFPIHSFNQGISTIGGMIAKDEFGSRSMRYGNMREWIEELEFVNGRGELMKTRKADLMDVCGMEGITGVIVGATLKIHPLINRTASIFQTESLEEALSIARRLKLEKEVVMLEFFPPYVSRLIGLPEKYHVIIEFDSERGKITGGEYEVITDLSDKIYYFLYSDGYYNSEDPKFYFDKLPEFITFLEDNDIPYYGYLGLGVIFPFFRDDEPEKKEATLSIIKKIKVKLSTYGIGLTRKDFLDNFEKKLIHRVKLRHDPFGKLQKGKVIDFESIKTPDIKERTAFQVRERTGFLPEPEEEKIEKPREIKPEPRFVSGEERSVAKLLDELKNELDDSEKKIKEIAEPIIEGIESSKQELKKREQEEIGREIRERLADYEYTYESELETEKVKKVEELARNIPKEISQEQWEAGKVKVSDELDREIKKPEKTESDRELRGKISDDEKSMIDRIMTNKYREEKEDGNRS